MTDETLEQWFARKVAGFENDPAYIGELLKLERGENVALRAECERLREARNQLEEMALREAECKNARIAQLGGELGLALEYFERGIPYWYGTSPADRIRDVLEGRK